MKKAAASGLAFAIFAVGCGWCVYQLGNCFRLGILQNVFDASLSAREVEALGLLISALLCLILMNETQHSMRQFPDKQRFTFLTLRVSGLLGLLATQNHLHASTQLVPHATPSVPIKSVMSPTLATAVFAHIVRRRQEQIHQRIIPSKMTMMEIEILRDIQQNVDYSTPLELLTLPKAVSPDIQRVLHAVDRVQIEEELPDVLSPTPWIVEVKVFGYPMVVSIDGNVAEFRKKRSLELLTWLTLNRDRARRSAARTALWEIDISDSSFSTIVSDMRRGLRDLETSVTSDEWLPPTYSDELPLHALVVTDADRLVEIYNLYRTANHLYREELLCALSGIRDVPFAGTSYAWADLDGTTTRLVITAIEICSAIAETAGESGDSVLLNAAANAGLRVLPGCEELLDVQRRYLSSVYSLRQRKAVAFSACSQKEIL